MGSLPFTGKPESDTQGEQGEGKTDFKDREGDSVAVHGQVPLTGPAADVTCEDNDNTLVTNIFNDNGDFVLLRIVVGGFQCD